MDGDDGVTKEVAPEAISDEIDGSLVVPHHGRLTQPYASPNISHSDVCSAGHPPKAVESTAERFIGDANNCVAREERCKHSSSDCDLSESPSSQIVAGKLVGDSIGLHPLYAAVADPRNDTEDAEIERNGNVEPKPILSSKKIRDAGEN